MNSKKIEKIILDYWPLGVFTVLGVILDQVTKLIARNTLHYEGNTFTLIKNFFAFTLVFNDGAVASILSGQMVFFYIVTLIVLVAIVYFYGRQKNKFARFCYGLIFPGAIGNFIDRIFFKEVTDFLHFQLFEFPVFNVADILLVCGTIGLMIYLIFIEGRHEHQ